VLSTNVHRLRVLQILISVKFCISSFRLDFHFHSASILHGIILLNFSFLNILNLSTVSPVLLTLIKANSEIWSNNRVFLFIKVLKVFWDLLSYCFELVYSVDCLFAERNLVLHVNSREINLLILVLNVLLSLELFDRLFSSSGCLFFSNSWTS